MSSAVKAQRKEVCLTLLGYIKKAFLIFYFLPKKRMRRTELKSQ